MNSKYTLIIFGAFLIVSILFMYMMFSGNWNGFLSQLKWFMRITTPFFIIFVFYLGIRNKKNS